MRIKSECEVKFQNPLGYPGFKSKPRRRGMIVGSSVRYARSPDLRQEYLKVDLLRKFYGVRVWAVPAEWVKRL